MVWGGAGQGTQLAQAGLFLSRSPGCDSHHGAAGVSSSGGGDTGVPDLLCDWPARARIPVVLWEAGGEVPLCHIEQDPCTPSVVRDPHR